MDRLNYILVERLPRRSTFFKFFCSQAVNSANPSVAKKYLQFILIVYKKKSIKSMLNCQKTKNLLVFLGKIYSGTSINLPPQKTVIFKKPVSFKSS